ncbi:DNA cytosine methyltransferase [Desemzia sp. FAM 23991]|uniref:DNA cytosine methyltransferase n=1 Tax=unclassified Desemzia TaxID=2685243 RepID=UPI00388850B6
MIKILELFGGIGAPRKALINLGVKHKSIDYVEWNEKAVRTYNEIFDNNYRSESVVGYDLKPDILIHGSPCQDFSIAGKQYGGNTEDGTRSSLMFETIRIIQNMGIWKPKIVVWENVKNVLSKRMMGAFNRYLSDMESLGYKNSFEVLDARDFGIPQARQRIFVVSKLDGPAFDFTLLEKKPTQNIQAFLESDVDDRYIITQPSMLKKINSSSTRSLNVIEDFAWTITTKQMRCPNSGIIPIGNGKYRLLTELECWRLMGFEDNDYHNAAKAHPRRKNFLNGTLYHQSGNSIVVDVLEELFSKILGLERG